MENKTVNTEEGLEQEIEEEIIEIEDNNTDKPDHNLEENPHEAPYKDNVIVESISQSSNVDQSDSAQKDQPNEFPRQTKQEDLDDLIRISEKDDAAAPSIRQRISKTTETISKSPDTQLKEAKFPPNIGFYHNKQASKPDGVFIETMLTKWFLQTTLFY